MNFLRAGLNLIFLFAWVCLTFGEIHRAKHPTTEKSNRARWRHSEDRNDEKGLFMGHTHETWIFSIIAAIAIGLSGILPLLVIPIEAGKALKNGASAAHLRLLLSFAVGGLLGDVFLHLLPEAWNHTVNQHGDHTSIGLWVLAGILCFFMLEKLFPDTEAGEATEQVPTDQPKLKENTQNGHDKQSGENGFTLYYRQTAESDTCTDRRRRPPASRPVVEQSAASQEPTVEHIKTFGWLNLAANVIDNFTHGLAVAGSFSAGTKVGLLTTFAILVHEIPHEIGDFAILLQAGFDRWKAAKAQLLTATGGVIGAVTALAAESAKSAGDRTAWILPFTSGGFIYIALVTVVPDLLTETRYWESLKQTVCLCAGIAVMATVTLLVD